jgi:DNA (cytosine-5)-methyltransferase 1
VRFVSLFSGCGGLDLGLKRAGFTPLMALDNDRWCAESHQANFPGVPFHHDTIAGFDSVKAVELTGGETLKEVALLAGGPPCPPYSKSRFYRKDKPRALDDPVGEVTMAGYLAFLRFLRPQAFLLENVAGLAYGVHRDALNHILEAATAEGYKCSSKVLNAADYGIPQIRERFFIVGVKRGTFTFPEPTHRDPARELELFGNPLPPWRTAGEVLCSLDTEENADDDGHFAGGAYHHLLRQVPPGDNYLYFTEKRGCPEPLFRWRSRYWSFLLKLSPDMPSWTIQARRSNNMGPFHWRNRILRISEIKRLQTFPDDWQLAGNVERQWRQIGNAVPPELAFHIGRAIAQHLVEHRAAERIAVPATA